MFGLWYLTLAIEEIRRLVGWNIFAFFTRAKTEAVPAIAPAAAPAPGPAKKAADSTGSTNGVKPAVVSPPSTTKDQTKEEAQDKPGKKERSSSKGSLNLPKEPEPVASSTPKAFVPTAKSEPAPPSIPPAKPAEKVDPVARKTDPSPPKLEPAPKKTAGSSPPKVAPAPQKGEPVASKPTPVTANPEEKNILNVKSSKSKSSYDPKKTSTDFLSGERRKQDNMVDAAVIKKLDEGYAKLVASDSKSLLKKHLTKEIFEKLKNTATPTFKSTLLDVIQSGLENHDSGVGIYAPDAESYTVFADLFDPIIDDYHGGFKKSDKHPASDFGDVSTFGNVDPDGKYVISTRVRCGRSLQGYPFNPCLTEAQYKEMEAKVSSTLSGLEGELKGKFYPLTGMDKAVQQQLIDDHFLFKEGDRFLQAANACRFWPSGRGIYHNDNKTFLVWCNEEDHLRIISMQKGGDLGEIYRRLVTAVNEIEKRIPFSHDDRLGFLTFCPTNLGTTIRASVHIQLPKLAADLKKLEEVAGKYNLQVRGTRGEHTEAEGGIYDISNKRRMGLTEFDAVKEMYDGIAELIKIEKTL